MKKKVPKKIGEILIEEGVHPAYINFALLQQKNLPNVHLGQILLSTNLVSDELLAKALAKQYGWEYFSHVTTDLYHLPDLDIKFVEIYRVIPIHIGEKEIEVGFEDPSNYDALMAVRRRFPKKEVKKYVVSKTTIEKYIQTRAKVTINDIQRAFQTSNFPDAFRLILKKAIVEECTDIHIEPSYHGYKLKYRKDGMLFVFMNIPSEYSENLRQIILQVSGMDFSNGRIPQDGRISGDFIGEKFQKIDARVSYLPTFLGDAYSVVIRILNQQTSAMPLSALGLSDFAINFLKKVATKSTGMVLVVGPTGSGKSTTIYSALSLINALERKVISVEDPVEYRNYLWDQTQVTEKGGYTFTTAMKTLLRHDPDIIFLGEIRDKETAKMAVDAANTGHLVFSTLHTNSSLTSISRLLSLGVERSFLEGVLLGVVAQRLVRKLCDCKKPVQHPDFGEIYEAQGCPACHYSGYRGRMAISEVLPMPSLIKQGDTSLKVDKETSFRIFQYITEGQIFKAEKLMQEAGLHTLEEDALEKVKKGITSLEEIYRIC